LKVCDYGCGKEAKYQLKNGKYCCEKSQNSCIYMIHKLRNSRIKIIKSQEYREKMRRVKLGTNHSEKTKIKIGNSNKGKIVSDETKRKISNSKKGKKQTKEHIEKNRKSKIGKPSGMLGKQHSKKTKEKMSLVRKGRIHSEKTKIKIGKSNLKKRQRTIEMINVKHYLFSQIEEMRYNPDKPDEQEIQVHCKNHNCLSSKEQGGWFTPTKSQLHERIRNLKMSLDHSYFYCSQVCKNACPLYNLRNDPIGDNNLSYTPSEYQTFRKFVLERDEYTCQYCGNPATDVHHERPQKLEPFFALDPDFAWSCCEKCHYEKGHKNECSTGKLANITCD